MHSTYPEYLTQIEKLGIICKIHLKEYWKFTGKNLCIFYMQEGHALRDYTVTIKDLLYCLWSDLLMCNINLAANITIVMNDCFFFFWKKKKSRNDDQNM